MIDLFAGPGGLDVAAKWLDIPSVGIELDVDACETRRAAGIGTRCSDVRNLSLLDCFENADILTGGPPCQTFSVAGSGVGRKALDQVLEFIHRMDAGEDVSEDLDSLDDPRTGLVLQPLRWALAAMEKNRSFATIVLEQVPTVKPVWDAIAIVLRSRGYEAEVKVIRTEQYGVPQTRRRAILIARHGRIVTFPKPTHRKYVKGVEQKSGDQEYLPWVSMAEAFTSLQHRPKEFIVVSNYGTGGKPDIRGRRTSSEPSATITGKIRRNRLQVGKCDIDRLEPREAGLLQTFPIDYPWDGTDKYQQVGNAIPPRVAVHILAAAVFEKKPVVASLDQAIAKTWDEARAGKIHIDLEEMDDVEGKQDVLLIDENLNVVGA